MRPCAILLVVACSVTESGNPPGAIRLVEHDQLQGSVEGDILAIVGTEAITPAGGDVLVANLDRPGLVIAPVSSMGSFDIGIPFESGDRLRLQPIDGELSPLSCDVERDEGVGLRVIDTSRLDCLAVRQVGETWTLANGCGRELDLQLRASRLGTTVTPASLVLSAGSETEVAVLPLELPDVISIHALEDVQVVMLTRSCPDADGDGLCDCADLDNNGICDP